MEFETSVGSPGPRAHGLSENPPFYKINSKDNSIEPSPPLSARDWDEIFEVMGANGITDLRAGGQMTDATLERLGQLDLVTSLDLVGSWRGCRAWSV